MADLFRVDIDTKALDGLAKGFAAAGKGAPAAMAAALNSSGRKIATQMRRALVAQTGLKYGVMVRALRTRSASAGSPEFRIESRGGDIRLRFFNARETKSGAIARPWNQKKLYPGAFMKGGRFPNRVPLNMGRGAVFEWDQKRGIISEKRLRNGKVRKRYYPIKEVRSGLLIPEEMIRGASKAAFEQGISRDLHNETVRALQSILAGIARTGR